MNTNGHTPGPWIRRGAFIDSSSPKRCIARAVESRLSRAPLQGQEVIANARLIAAAPELLKALELLIASVGSDPFSLTKQQRADMDFARVAVIKATS